MDIGDIVMYVVTEDDAIRINRRRTTGAAIAERIKDNSWPLGAQAHIGEVVNPGSKFPMIVTNAYELHAGGDRWVRYVTGQVFLNGSDAYYVTDVREYDPNTDSSRNGTWFPKY